MKTPLQELIQYESDLTHMFDSDVRVAGAILEYIRTNKKDMLEKEKELLVSQQREMLDWLSNEPEHNIIKSEINEILEDFKYYNETFNTKE